MVVKGKRLAIQLPPVVRKPLAKLSSSRAVCIPIAWWRFLGGKDEGRGYVYLTYPQPRTVYVSLEPHIDAVRKRITLVKGSKYILLPRKKLLEGRTTIPSEVKLTLVFPREIPPLKGFIEVSWPSE